MGTRGLTCVVQNGHMVVAQYGQWDHYLDGQGKTIFDFIKNKMKLRTFKEALSKCYWLNNAEIRKTWIEAGDKPNNTSGMVSMDIADKHSMLYPGLSRDTGAEILTLIQDGIFTRSVKVEGQMFGYERKTFTTEPVRGLADSSDFAADSLFCEWAYVLDMDNKFLEIYTGFCQNLKGSGRFAHLKKEKGEKYGPVQLWQTVPFSQCTKKKLKELIELHKKESKEEE